jgi:hypothetical protein
MKTSDNATIRRLDGDEEADSRLSSFLTVASVFFIGLMFIAMSTDPVKIGVNKGEMPPNITGDARIANSAWFSFDLHSKFNNTWDGNTTSDRWFLVEFMDTDCPYCWRDAELMSQLDQQFGGILTTVVVVAELDITGHSSSREEIIAFQDKTDYDGCYSGNRNCAERPGGVHQGTDGNLFYYVDDLQGKSLSSWNLQGTPSCFLLRPNGLVDFNSAQDGGCDQLGGHMYELFGSGGGA